MARVKTIGTNALSYPEIRNFAGYKYQYFRFKKVIDFYKFPSYFLFKIKGKINKKWLNSYMDWGLNRCDFYHFFNVLNLGNKPFITTYETVIPRWNDSPKEFKKGLEIIARKNCIQVIAISQSAFNRQANIIKTYRPDLLDVIMQKNRVILPPQINFIDTIDHKKAIGNTIVFTIVGADFFRKGGQAIMAVFEQLLSENKPIHLNIVSTLNYGDYASKTTKKDLEKVETIISKFANRITYYKSMSNDGVKKLLLETDVALLPSLAETFGYFILEAQAAGCPVITTDIRAMPEINNPESGWLININTDGRDDADLTHPNQLIQKIENQLQTIIIEILNDPSIIRKKGSVALANIIKNHDPKTHQTILESIYNTIE
jgi:glycosyltransferase involved in cell wall biosynthesis